MLYWAIINEFAVICLLRRCYDMFPGCSYNIFLLSIFVGVTKVIKFTWAGKNRNFLLVVFWPNSIAALICSQNVKFFLMILDFLWIWWSFGRVKNRYSSSWGSILCDLVVILYGPLLPWGWRRFSGTLPAVATGALRYEAWNLELIM